MEIRDKLQKSYDEIKCKLLDIKKNYAIPEINKIIHKCDAVYNDVIKSINSNNVKKQEIECFNWFEIYTKIIEIDGAVSLSKTFDNNNDSKDNSSKNSKEYVISQDKKRIYKIISKPTDYVNNSIDVDYYKNFCILDVIQNYIKDAQSIKHFPYKSETTKLYIFFKEEPCEELLEEIKSHDIIPLNLNCTNITKKEENKCVNIDINIIIALCSDLQYLHDDSEIIKKILEEKTFIGYDIRDTENFTCKEFCDYIKNENKKITDEIKKYDKVILCKSAYDDSMRILNLSGSCTEKQRLQEIIKEFNMEIINDELYNNELIDDNSKNYTKKFYSVEKDVLKIGYIFNALTLTSNHRFADYLLSRNILIEYKNITSLNLISTAKNKIKN